jgi:phospholipase/lecithinase/hemolysin
MRANEPVNGLFQRYVSVGNSITAGFQSGGINETSQAQSYAVLLAGQMDTEFFVPYMKNPGCPPPYANVFTQTRIDPTTCALRRQESFPPPYMNNVAVPGAEVIDAVNNLDPASNANQLTQFMLGGLTQIQMLQRVDPTFVSVWLGNNDVLGSATNSSDAGNPALVTPPATFAERYDGVLDAIQATSPGGVILIGVPNVTVIPYFSLGQVYFALKNQPSSPFPPTFTVGPNCAPSSLGGKGDSVLVPFPFGGTLLAQAALGNAVTLSCTEAQTVQPSELINLVSTVTAYNQTIVSEATARNWGYYDPNPALDSLRALPAEVAPFPNFGTPPAFTPCDQNPFGLAFSCDAVHPSARTHKLIANKISQAINAKYGTSLAQIP